jgi:hypothetical protein
MIGTMLAGVAGIIAAPAVGGLVWRRARQRRVAKALEITTPTWPWPRWHRRGGRHLAGWKALVTSSRAGSWVAAVSVVVR